MERKTMDDLLAWKRRTDNKPLIIYGARQVGKTYLVREFANKYYDNIFEINFELEQEIKKAFDGNLSVDNIIMQISSYMPNQMINGKKTLIFFDEVQKCPPAITALKSFAQDDRYDVIASGSMLGVTMSEVSSYPVGYVYTLIMKPLSFEEFLLANNYSHEQIQIYESFFKNEELIPEGIHEALTKMFLQYAVVGGMPEVVKTFVDTHNINLVIQKQKMILNDYKNDIGKYAPTSKREKIRVCYDSIPDQLAMENKKFQFKTVKSGGNARFFQESLNWIQDAGLAQEVHRLKTFDLPLRAYRDISSFKLYFIDTGLLLAMYEDNVQFEILNGNLGVFKGGIFENLIAQMLSYNNLPLYYYRRDEKLEIDFVTSLNGKIVPIEIKSGKNTKSISLTNIINKEHLEYGIKLSLNNINCNNPKFKCFPLYMAMFLKNAFDLNF